MTDLRVGSFVLDSPVGGGGFGVVWRGHHEDTGTQVAIKIMRGRPTPAILTAFRNEVRAAARLDHPYIVSIHGTGTVSDALAAKLNVEPGAPWLGSSWGGTTTLEGKLAELKTIRRWLFSLCEALAHAHARGVLHLDLKPANVMLSATAQVRLGDFGISALLDEPHKRNVMGSPGFMSPEQILGEPLTPSSDIYALGCLAWTMIVGAPPFEGATPIDLLRQHAYSPIHAPEHLPEGVREWLNRCLSKSPLDRFEHAIDARDALWESDLSAPPCASLSSASTSETFVFAEEISVNNAISSSTRSTATRLPEAPPIPTLDDMARARARRMRATELGPDLASVLVYATLGREDERAALWELARRVEVSAAPLVVWLTGPAQVGTSHLARWLAWTAGETGAMVSMRIPHKVVQRLTVVHLDHPEPMVVDGLAEKLHHTGGPLLVLLSGVPTAARPPLGCCHVHEFRVDRMGFVDQMKFAFTAGLQTLPTLRRIIHSDGLPGLILSPKPPRPHSYVPSVPILQALQALEQGDPQTALSLVWDTSMIWHHEPLVRANIEIARLALDALGTPNTNPKKVLNQARIGYLAYQDRSQRFQTIQEWFKDTVAAHPQTDLICLSSYLQACAVFHVSPDNAEAILTPALELAHSEGLLFIEGMLLERYLRLGIHSPERSLRAVQIFRQFDYGFSWIPTIIYLQSTSLRNQRHYLEARDLVRSTLTELQYKDVSTGLLHDSLAEIEVELGHSDAARRHAVNAREIHLKNESYAVLTSELTRIRLDLYAGKSTIRSIQSHQRRVREVLGGANAREVDFFALLIQAAGQSDELFLAEFSLRALEDSTHTLTPTALAALYAAESLLPQLAPRLIALSKQRNPTDPAI